MKWRLSELTPMIFNTGLTHLGSETSKYRLSFNPCIWKLAWKSDTTNVHIAIQLCQFALQIFICCQSKYFFSPSVSSTKNIIQMFTYLKKRKTCDVVVKLS